MRRLGLLVCLLLTLSGIQAAQASPECEPGEAGCLPSPEQCASGDYNGYWDGGRHGRFAICLGAGGHTIGYAGGTALPGPCGHLMVADQTVPGASDDPNECHPPTGGGGDDSLAGRAARVGLRNCQTGTTSEQTPPVVPFITCAGEMRSFDGTEIDARLTFPANATGPVPLVLLMHGWGYSRVVWQTEEGDRTDRLGRGRFLAEGYAVLSPTSRGFQASCGQFDQIAEFNSDGSTWAHEENPRGCERGWTHLAERGWEGRDAQTMLGQLVDAGVADPQRLAAYSESYGGGSVWHLATSLPWSTPEGHTIRLAAAVPQNSWTDLLGALVPNGRSHDGLSPVPSPAEPLGAAKLSALTDLWGRGRLAIVPPLTTARYNTTEPQETHSHFDGWMAALATAEQDPAAAAAYLEEAMAGKSAMRADGFFAAVARGEVEPTPLLAIQGWTDPIFTAVQPLQMYRKLKSLRPDYPIHLFLRQGGHGSPERHLAQYEQAATDFIVSHLSAVEARMGSEELSHMAEDGGRVSPEVTSLRATCDDEPVLEAVEASGWDSIGTDVVELSSDDVLRTTSTPADPVLEASLDPAVSRGRDCAPAPAEIAGPRWRWTVPEDGLEMIGLPRATVDFSMEGDDVPLVLRMWDVSDGGRNLITTGVYRVSAPIDGQQGTVSFALFGNHYRFEAGRTIELEASQTDAPYLSANTSESALILSGVMLQVPVR